MRVCIPWVLRSYFRSGALREHVLHTGRRVAHAALVEVTSALQLGAGSLRLLLSVYCESRTVIFNQLRRVCTAHHARCSKMRRTTHSFALAPLTHSSSLSVAQRAGHLLAANQDFLWFTADVDRSTSLV